MLDNKVIVISGGTKGVGRDLAYECARNGARVVIAGRDESAGKKIEELINGEQRGSCVFSKCDISKVEECKKMFTDALDNFGRVDDFVNYAGITPIETLEEITEETVNSVLSINLKAALFCCKFAILAMKDNENGGSIILVNSCHAKRGEKDRVAYACSKGALLTLTNHIAAHYAQDKIRCNTLTMGWTATEGELNLRAEHGMNAEELKEVAARSIPMGRMQTSEDYIPSMIMLLRDSSQMTSGSNIQVSGGLFL